MIRYGDEGEDVEILQARLGMRVDGIYGAHTLRAVEHLQAWTGCHVDGVVGPETWAALHAWRPDPVMSRASAYRGWQYAHDVGGVRFASDMHCLPRRVALRYVRGVWDADPGIDCIGFALGVVGGLLGRRLSPARYPDLMLWEGRGRWSNVDALIDAEVALERDEPGDAWCYVQGWRLYPTAGHTMLARRAPGGGVLVLESQPGRGPSWRGGDRLRSMVPPWRGVEWASLADRYPDGLRLVEIDL